MATPPCVYPATPTALAPAAAAAYTRVCSSSAYKPDLPIDKLRSGVVHSGGAFGDARLKQFVGKLLTGGNVSIATIGGSITWGDGVKNRGADDWFAVVTSWLRGAFPAAQLSAANKASPGTLSEYVSMCINKFAQEDADLVFIEFSVNDGFIEGGVDNPRARSYERLLRKLLRRPNGPAVVLVNFLETNIKRNGLPFYHTIEDHYNTVAQYYGVPSLSMRGAVWHDFMSDASGYTLADIFAPGDQRHANNRGHKIMADLAVSLLQRAFVELMIPDPGQPTGEGSSDNATAVEADASAAAAAATAAAGAATSSWPPSPPLPPAAMPPPMFKDNEAVGGSQCASGIDVKNAAVASDGFYFINENTRDKPKWGWVAYSAGATLTLLVDTRVIGGAPIPSVPSDEAARMLQYGGEPGAIANASRAAAAAGVVAKFHYKIRNESEQAPPVSPGATAGAADAAGNASAAAATAPDAATNVSASAAPLISGGHRRLLLRLLRRRPLQEPPEVSPQQPRDMVVWLGYLVSYESMGVANVTCVGGCSCDAARVDGHISERRSQQALTKVLVSQSEACRLVVRVAEETRSSHHKFKVSGVMVSRDVGYTDLRTLPMYLAGAANAQGWRRKRA